MANILYESCTTVLNTYGFTQDAVDNYLLSQSFTPVVAHKLVSVDLYLYRTGTPGNCLLNVYASDSGADDDKPTGPVLATATFDGDDVGEDVGGVDWFSIELAAGVNLTAGTKYVLVLSAPTGDNTNKLHWGYSTTADQYATGKRGFSTNAGVTWFPQNTHDHWFKEYGSTAPSASSQLNYSKALVAIGGNCLYHESPEGTMIPLADSVDSIDTINSMIDIVEAYEKVFIVNESIKKIADFGNIKLTTNASGIGAAVPNHGNLLTCAATGAKIVVDYITSFVDDAAVTIYGKRTTSTQFSSADVIVGTNDADAAISITLGDDEAAGPFWYDWNVYGDLAGVDTTYGKLPDEASIICLYRGRIAVAGDPGYPNQWYMFRQSNPWDLVVTSTDAQAAVIGQNSDAGKLGDAVVALAPYKDDYLVFGCANSMWLLAGDPRSGGELSELDLTTGIYGKKSWCFDSFGNFYFWGNNGLYKTTLPGYPMCISQQALPKLIADEAADPSTHRITLGFDHERNGILICITVLATGKNSNYFYSLTTEGFFPESYPDTCGVSSIFFYAATNTAYKKLLLGNNDGYLRYFDDAQKDDVLADDSTIPIESHVSFGPLLIANDPKYEGKLTGLIPILAGGCGGGGEADSNNVECKLFVADSADSILEKLVANTAPNFARTIIAPGRSRTNILRRKIRGVYAGIRLGNTTAAQSWSLDQLLIDGAKAGRLK